MAREENDAIMAELEEMVGEQLFDKVTLDAAHLAFRKGNLAVAKSLVEGPFYQPLLKQSHREGIEALLNDISTAEGLAEPELTYLLLPRDIDFMRGAIGKGNFLAASFYLNRPYIDEHMTDDQREALATLRKELSAATELSGH